MHNTGNPLGSKDILDLYDNSETIDNFVNSQQDEIPDRFGVKRLTLAGLIKRSMALRNEINDFSGAITFKPEWTDVPMNVSEGVGGEGGALNLQAEALGNRSEINKITSREALRRTYQEVGLNLVEGSFEAGGTLVNTNDVLLQECTGKAFSGPAGDVAAGTDPANGGFVDKSGSLAIETFNAKKLLLLDGSDTLSSIAQAVSSIRESSNSSRLKFSDGHITVPAGSTLTLSGFPEFHFEGFYFTVQGNLVISGEIHAGGDHLFRVSGNGSVSNPIVSAVIRPEWFGVTKTNSATENDLHLQAVLHTLGSTNSYELRLSGRYSTNSSIILPTAIKAALVGSKVGKPKLYSGLLDGFDFEGDQFAGVLYDGRNDTNNGLYIGDVCLIGKPTVRQDLLTIRGIVSGVHVRNIGLISSGGRAIYCTETYSSIFEDIECSDIRGINACEFDDFNANELRAISATNVAGNGILVKNGSANRIGASLADIGTSSGGQAGVRLENSRNNVVHVYFEESSRTASVSNKVAFIDNQCSDNTLQGDVTYPNHIENYGVNTDLTSFGLGYSKFINPTAIVSNIRNPNFVSSDISKWTALSGESLAIEGVGYTGTRSLQILKSNATTIRVSVGQDVPMNCVRGDVVYVGFAIKSNQFLGFQGSNTAFAQKTIVVSMSGDAAKWNPVQYRAITARQDWEYFSMSFICKEDLGIENKLIFQLNNLGGTTVQLNITDVVFTKTLAPNKLQSFLPADSQSLLGEYNKLIATLQKSGVIS